MTRTHRRILGTVLLVGFLVYAVPTAKNLYLHWTYKYGDEALTRVEGESGSLAGVWVATSDYLHCMPEGRTRKRLEIDPDGTGYLHSQFFGKRVVVGYSNPYSWASVLPWTREPSHEYIEPVIDSLGTLVITRGLYWDTGDGYLEYLAYEVHGDKLYLGYAEEVGQQPEFWGLRGSFRPPLRNILRPWWW